MIEATKRGRGRPPKAKPVEDTVQPLEEGGQTVDTTPKAREPGSKYTVKRRDGSLELRKTRWTRGIIEKRFPMVEIYPEATVPLTWQGVTYFVNEGIPITIPQPHADIYREYQRNLHLRRGNIAIVEGQAIHVSPNAGGLDGEIEGLE